MDRIMKNRKHWIKTIFVILCIVVVYILAMLSNDVSEEKSLQNKIAEIEKENKILDFLIKDSILEISILKGGLPGEVQRAELYAEYSGANKDKVRNHALDSTRSQIGELWKDIEILKEKKKINNMKIESLTIKLNNQASSEGSNLTLQQTK